MNIALFLEMATDVAADRTALVCDSKRWSYAQLLTGARGAAALIRDNGCAHVALLGRITPALIVGDVDRARPFAFVPRARTHPVRRYAAL